MCLPLRLDNWGELFYWAILTSRHSARSFYCCIFTSTVQEIDITHEEGILVFPVIVIPVPPTPPHTQPSCAGTCAVTVTGRGAENISCLVSGIFWDQFVLRSAGFKRS